MMRQAPLVFIAVLLLQIVVLLWVYVQWRRMKTRQDELVHAMSGQRFWRTVFARPQHLRSLWKLIPFQASGVVVDEGGQLRLQGWWRNSGSRFDLVVPKSADAVVWRGVMHGRNRQMHWAQVRAGGEEVMVAVDTGWQTLGSREALADLFRSALPGLPLPAQAGSAFALEKNRMSLAAMAAMLVLGGFALVDTHLVSRYELVESQWLGWLIDPAIVAPAVLALAGGGLAAYALLRRSVVPTTESAVLAVMLAGAAAAATVPALKRADQWLAHEGSRDYRYRLSPGPQRIVPVSADAGLPLLRFTRAREYWAQFKAGDEVSIPLLHGPLGLWQIDHVKFDPPIKAFYQQRRSGKAE